MNRIGKPTVNLQQIAAAAGVHLSTVSLALRNSPSLPVGTCRRLQQMARRLGYTPNPLVSMLMSRVRRRTALNYRGTLAYVHTTSPRTAKLKATVYRNFVTGAKRRAEAFGYRLDEFFLSPDALNARRLGAVLHARNIAGVVIEHIPGPACPGRRLPLNLARFAAASLCTPLAYPSIDYVANDQFMRAIIAARELLALGYRRLGLVLYDTFDSAMAHRCSAGFWAVLNYIDGLAPIPICHVQPGERGEFRRWLGAHRPDVILGTDWSVLELTHQMGRRVPDDIGWVHLDWFPEHKPAAGVHGNSERTGAAAVELVMLQLHRGETGPPSHAMSYLVEGSWVPGKTIRQVGPALDLDASFFAELLKA